MNYVDSKTLRCLVDHTQIVNKRKPKHMILKYGFVKSLLVRDLLTILGLNYNS